MADIPEEAASDIRVSKNALERSSSRRIIVVLQQASLETVKTKKVRLALRGAELWTKPAVGEFSHTYFSLLLLVHTPRHSSSTGLRALELR